MWAIASRREVLLQNMSCLLWLAHIWQTAHHHAKHILLNGRLFHLPIDERGLRHQHQSSGHVWILSRIDSTRTDPQCPIYSWDNLRQHFLNFYTPLNLQVSLSLRLCSPKRKITRLDLPQTSELSDSSNWFAKLIHSDYHWRLLSVTVWSSFWTPNLSFTPPLSRVCFSLQQS